MKRSLTFLFGFLILSISGAGAQSAAWRFPAKVEAGTAFSTPTTGSGAATLYIVGPGDALRRNIQLGESIPFGSRDLLNAGHYVAFLIAGSSVQSAAFDVTASSQPASLSFLAKPSRLAVNQPNGLSGVVYLLDRFRNLAVQPQSVMFELSDPTGRTESRAASTHNGVAWVKMNSTAKAGFAQFQAIAGTVRERRVVQQIAGEPCAVKMTARAATPGGEQRKVVLETEQLRDCNGNASSDGTIVTFTEVYGGRQATVDVPLKRGVAQTELAAQNGAIFSVASGIVTGNEIRWSGGR